MKRLLSLLVLVLAGRPGAVRADPRLAIVRIPSHGASGVVISTTAGLSYVLSAAHAFEGEARLKRVELDVPNGAPGQARTGGIRLVKVDYARDLALLEVRAGPLPHVCPVAPEGHR